MDVGEVGVQTIPFARRTPVQERSAHRVAVILDTTAQIIKDGTVKDLSISQIAKTSGISGPSVYRYFDDLTAILKALAQRNLERYVIRVAAVLGDDERAWEDAIAAIVHTYADFFRDEPGFHWLRLGDRVDTFLLSEADDSRTLLARHMTQMFFERYEVDWRADLLEHVEVMVEIADSLVARAFETDPQGEPFFIDECERILVQYLGEYLAQPHPLIDRPVDWMTQRPTQSA